MSRHREAFEEFADSVKGIDGVEEIVLFGSVARGDERSESDVDVLVVVEDKSLRQRIIDKAYDVTLEKGVYVSPKVLSSDEYERLKSEGSMFLREVEREGVSV